MRRDRLLLRHLGSDRRADHLRRLRHLGRRGDGVTEPGPLHRPIPGCTSCGSPETVTVDGINGKRCADHPPTFDPSTAVELMRRGLPGAAGAYIRSAT